MDSVNSQLSAAGSLARFLNFAKAKPTSPETLKFAGRELAAIMRSLNLEDKKDFAKVMEVTPSCVGRWLNGARMMKDKSIDKLKQLVQSHENCESGTEYDGNSWNIPHHIPYERLEHLYVIASLLNEAGSEMTVTQVLCCIAD